MEQQVVEMYFNELALELELEESTPIGPGDPHSIPKKADPDTEATDKPKG